MTEPVKDELSKKDKVTILLSEYSTLRAEILARTGHMFQFIAIFAALLIWLSGRAIDLRFWVVFVIGASALAYTTFPVTRDIRKAARRLREIEHDINNRAGEELLVWETVWGCQITGYYGRAKPIRTTDKVAREAEAELIANPPPLADQLSASASDVVPPSKTT